MERIEGEWKMRNRFASPLTAPVIVSALLAFSSITLAQISGQPQKGQPQTAAMPASQQDPRDLSGVWFAKPLPGASGANAVVPPPLDLKLRPPMTPWAQETYKNNIPNGGPRSIYGKEGNDPILRCYPDGVPKIQQALQPFEIIQIPGRVMITYEINGQHRQIWTDGRGLPKDPQPSYMGYSVGRWEEDTLVVDSNGFNAITWLDRDGSPHSEELQVTERYRRLDHNTLEIAVTVEDPKAYTKPWVGKPALFALKNWELMEHYCIFDEEMKYRNSIMLPSGGAPLPPVEKK